MPTTATVAPTIVSTAAQTPQWYDELASQFGNTISGGLTQASSLAGNWYNQPLTQGLSPEQQGLIDQSGKVAGQWRPQFTAGLNTLNGAQTGINQAGAATGQITSGMPAAQKLWGQAADLYDKSADMTRDASTYNAAEMQQHLNPYLSGVMDELGRRGNENLMQNVIPGINQSFTGSGMFGSSRQSNKFLPEAIAKNQREILGAQATAGLSAYDQAAKDYANWGQLGLTGAKQMGDLGTATAGLGTTQATTPAKIFGDQATSFLSNASAQGSLGGQQMQSGITGQNAAWGDISKQFELQEAERANKQAGLDASYKDWQNQVATPYNLMGGLGQMMPHISGLYGKGTTVVTPAPASNSTTAADILAILSAAGSGYNAG